MTTLLYFTVLLSLTTSASSDRFHGFRHRGRSVHNSGLKPCPESCQVAPNVAVEIKAAISKNKQEVKVCHFQQPVLVVYFVWQSPRPRFGSVARSAPSRPIDPTSPPPSVSHSDFFFQSAFAPTQLAHLALRPAKRCKLRVGRQLGMHLSAH